jgi:hypothetical protein
MLKSFIIERQEIRNFGAVFSQDFYLPHTLKLITDIAVFISYPFINVSSPPVSFGECAVSVNEVNICTIKSLNMRSSPYASLQHNFTTLDRPIAVKTGSQIRFTFEEITDQIPLLAGYSYISKYFLKIFIKYK